MQVPAGRVVAVCVGSVRSRRARGRTHRTAFDKQPVAGPVPLHALGLAGDEHAYRHHGGEDQALLVYSRDHYPFWRNEYGLDLPEAGAFGENLTVEGLTESEVCIGDSFRIGSVVIQVTSPRSPCYKTGLRYGRSELPRAMQDTLRVGYLMRVVTGGEVAAGGRVELVERPGRAITVAEAARVFNRDRDDWEAVARLVAIPELAQAVRAKLRSRLASRNGGRDEDRLDGEGTGVSEA